MSKNVQTVIRDSLKRLPFGDKLVDFIRWKFFKIYKSNEINDDNRVFLGETITNGKTYTAMQCDDTPLPED